MGDVKPGSARASTNLAEQNEVIVPIVKQRSPKKRSEDVPAALLLSRTSHS
jgi:hypothetical protein